jgi:LysR family transcriptional regulator, hydrogen peroxide-inducible genes activator
MTLNELRYIVAVSRERNFRRAAERCFVTQPALSLAIQKLEEELGVKLFERKKNDISLTTVGEAIIEQAARVLDEADKIRQLARQGTNPLVGAIRFGAIYTVGPYLLPELIPILRRQAPEMPLDVEENTTANLENQLRNGLLDAVVIALPFNVPGVETTPLYDEGFVVAVPVDHPWANKKNISAADLAQEKVLLLNSGHCFSNQVMEACPSLSRNGEVLQGNSLETVRNMVSSGLGITVLPMSATTERYGSPLLKMIPFSAPMPTRRIALAWRKSFGRIAALDVIASSVKQITSPGFMRIA